MLRNIFVPERLGSYYLITTRVAAFEFTKTGILCVVIINSGTQKKLDLCLEEPFHLDATAPFAERAEITLKSIFKKIGTIHQTIFIIPAHNAVIKEILLPFSDPEKIRLVAPYEAEGLLPFSISDALADAIPLQQESAENTRTLVAALQREHYRDYSALFDTLALLPDRVTLDIVELIPLAKRIALSNPAVLTIVCDIGQSSTRIIAQYENRTALIRSIPRGTNHFTVVPQEILFTIDAARRTVPNAPSHLYVVGIGAENQNILEIIHQETNLTVEKVSQHRLLNGIIAHNSPVQHRYAIALEAASASTLGLSLDHARVHDKRALLRAKQALVALCGATALFSILTLYAVITIHGMFHEAYASEQEAIERLRKTFALPLKNSTTLEQTIANSERELAKEENILFALSSKNRFSFLYYLQELSNRIDRIKLGLDIRKFVIRSGESGEDDTLTIEGNVKDYDALRTLEESLIESKLFRVVPKLQETKFVISLIVDKKGGES